jgi:aspartyl-tRNA synthetase
MRQLVMGTTNERVGNTIKNGIGTTELSRIVTKFVRIKRQNVPDNIPVAAGVTKWSSFWIISISLYEHFSSVMIWEAPHHSLTPAKNNSFQSRK